MKTRDEIKAAADRAYIRYVDLSDRDACKGEAFKIEGGYFTQRNLNAHREASVEYGRYLALMDLLNETADKG